ncbi:MAG: YajQ family cyclic di-GMP-binding protein [bacterium]
MAKEHSFDIVCNIDMQVVRNVIDQAMREIKTRYDLKGTITEMKLEENNIKILSDDDYKLKSVIDILKGRLVKNKISLKALEFGQVETASMSHVRQNIALQAGIPTDKAKEIVKFIKQMKNKVQGQIQKDQVRVVGKDIDTLRAVMDEIKQKDWGIETQFVNYR